MSTLQHTDSLIEEFVAVLNRLAPQDQTIFLNRLREVMKEAVATPEKQDGEESRVDVEQRQTL